MPGRIVAVLLALALAGCSKGGSALDKLEKKWLAAKWTPVSGSFEGVRFRVELPDGLPENTQYLRGKDWSLGMAPGPEMTLSPTNAAYASPEEFAAAVDDPSREDLVIAARDSIAGGRFRFARQLKYGSHHVVSVWIPVDAARGVNCTARWYDGPDAGRRRRGKEGPPPPPPIDQPLIDWLDRFCQSVVLTPE